MLGTLLHATNRYTGAFFTDTFGITNQLFLNVAGRYNRATETLEDRLGTALNGHDTFNRFNPAVGSTAIPASALTIYANYNEGMRVPTPVELSCADPNAPCSLPNAFSADPPLKAVVAKTLEAGARGTLFGDINFSAAVFRTNLDQRHTVHQCRRRCLSSAGISRTYPRHAVKASSSAWTARPAPSC